MRVGRAGGRTWVVRYRTPTDTWRRLKLGRYPSMSLAQARQATKQVLADVPLGGDPRRGRARQRRARTIQGLAQDYLERHAKRNKHSWVQDQAILDQHILPVISGLDRAGMQDVILGDVPVDRHLGQFGLVDDDQQIVILRVAPLGVLHPVVAGMPADVTILAGERTIWSYLVSPIADYGSGA